MKKIAGANYCSLQPQEEVGATLLANGSRVVYNSNKAISLSNLKNQKGVNICIIG